MFLSPEQADLVDDLVRPMLLLLLLLPPPPPAVAQQIAIRNKERTRPNRCTLRMQTQPRT
jgi:hypothetical protein